jgi:hypothetical protein
MSDAWQGNIRAMLYGVQFEKDPLNGIDRIMRRVVYGGALGCTPQQYLEAIETALASNVMLSELLPQDHPEATVRAFLSEIRNRLTQSPVA